MSDEPPLSQGYFLSYSRADERFALRFATDLRAQGIAIWVDQLDIRPSEHWDRAIERAVHECRGLVVILSPRSAASDNVADEVSFAIDSGKSVLPVMIERCTLPLRITRMHLIDATGNYEKALRQCLGELARDDGAPARSAARPAPARGIADPEAIATAKEQLVSILGPIAAIIVDKAASRASSVKELYSLLTQHIEDAEDRTRFAAMADGPARTDEPGKPATLEQSSIAAADVERMASVLAHYLGPMAAVVARRESAKASSADELIQRLAPLIADERERADFLRRLQAR